jgi:hypothetical protein
MTTKNYGSGVSGYLDPEGRAWETTVHQAGKAILDKELNLDQDTNQDARARLRRLTFPSGWLSENYLGSSVSDLFISAPTTADAIELTELMASINGWTVRVEHTTSPGSTTNLLSLSTGPSGAGGKRTDLVILEVWRRLLAPAPSTDGKSPSGRIWWQGNVKIDASEDVTQNYADDILDGTLGVESTERVQIQYRLRVIDGVDLLTYPNGMDDPTVVANTVPASAAAPDGVATAYFYNNQSSVGDPGLWKAGDGNPANGMGTVDGYMYAIPLCGIFRRNTTAFDRVTNHNGGVAYPGPSDRPDGYFYDIIESRDVQDLRLGTSPTGWDLNEVLQKNTHFLLDNTLRTEIMDTSPLGGGMVGSTTFWADEVGVSNANGGSPPTTGDTAGAVFIGEFDACRRRYSDRSIIETLVLKYLPTDGSGGGPNWAATDIVTINPAALKVWPYPAFNWSAYAPSGVTFRAVKKAFFIRDTAAAGVVKAASYTLTGLGGVPQGSLSLTVTDVTSITDEPLYIWVEVEYPAGVGLTNTPVNDFSASSLAINNPSQLPATSPIYYDQPNDFGFDYPHREVNLEYQTQEHTLTYEMDTTLLTSVPTPERILTVNAYRINGGPGGPVTISSDGFELSFAATSPGDILEFDVLAARPFPQNDEQVTIYYESTAPQTIREAFLPNTVDLRPLYISEWMYASTVGSGSQDETFPWPQQYVQVGSVYPGSGGTFSGEHEMDGSGFVVVSTLSANTGLLKLPINIPMAPIPEDFSFGRAPGDVDAEGRTYYKTSASSYVPSAVSLPLSDERRHKDVVPILAELPADNTFGKKGQLFLLLISRFADSDSENNVGFLSALADNTTTASVYRLKGNLLNGRRS